MPTELLIDFDEFWTRLNADIASAEQSVFIQTFSFEGDAAGKQLAQALLSSSASDKRVLADSFTRFVLSDRFRYAPVNLFDATLRREQRATVAMMSELQGAEVGIKFTNPYGASPRKLLSRNHKKMIIIDNRAAYIGGINFSEHNAAWHDMMLRLDDVKAIEFLRDDFLSTWTGHDQVAHEAVGDIELFSLDGLENRAAFKKILDLIDGARHSIFVESPYITFPFYEHLREAARRAVNVKIVTPEHNNWSHFANYARLESARSKIDLRLYQRGMSHLKAMLIDDEYLVAGSSNFDYLSYRLYQEVVTVLTDNDVIADFRARVMLPDLANSIATDCQASELSKQWLELKMRVVDAALTILT